MRVANAATARRGRLGEAGPTAVGRSVTMASERRRLESTLARLVSTFAARDLVLVDVASEPCGAWLVRFDLDGHRLHLRVSSAPAEGASLELRDVVITDEQRHPGMTNAIGSIGNTLQKRIPHLRCLYSAVTESGYDRMPDDDLLPYPTEMLLTLQFGAPLLDAADEQLLAFCELGIDTLFYALGKLHDELLEYGLPCAHPFTLD
jgi:hypothetical protein